MRIFVGIFWELFQSLPHLLFLLARLRSHVFQPLCLQWRLFHPLCSGLSHAREHRAFCQFPLLLLARRCVEGPAALVRVPQGLCRDLPPAEGAGDNSHRSQAARRQIDLILRRCFGLCAFCAF